MRNKIYYGNKFLVKYGTQADRLKVNKKTKMMKLHCALLRGQTSGLTIWYRGT